LLGNAVKKAGALLVTEVSDMQFVAFKLKYAGSVMSVFFKIENIGPVADPGKYMCFVFAGKQLSGFYREMIVLPFEFTGNGIVLCNPVQPAVSREILL
jgi:hypothetical protein